MSMFALTNARGETVDINNDKLLSYTPTGLGVQFTNTYSQYETYFKATKSTVTQGQFQIYILFGDVESQAYQTFSEFAQFLAYQPLTLTYTTSAGTWYRDGRLNSLTKTEIGGSTVFATDRINESFTLEFINNWYNNKTAEYKSYDPDPNLGTYGKIYGNQIADTSIQINSQGQQNKLVNTEFSPDFSGWYNKYPNPSSSNNVTNELIKSGTDGSGSNVVLHKNAGVWINSAPISVIAGTPVSFSASIYTTTTVTSGVPIALYIMGYDNNGNRTASTGYNVPISSLKNTPNTFKLENVVMTANTTSVYAVFGWNVSADIYISKPMLVFDTTVGGYVQGLEYNHVATPAYTYAYAPDYVYIEANRNTNEQSVPLVNKSQYFGLQKGSPCIITISGSPTDTLSPSWSVIQNGSIVATDGVLVSISENQKLVVSSYPEDQYARVYNPDGSYADVSQLQDFTKTNFVQIPEGESTVLFYVDNQATVNLTFKEERLLV